MDLPGLSRQLDRFKFRRRHPIDRYFADFACIEARLVVELDGDQHGDTAAYDAARTAVIEQAGYRVLRFANRDVLHELDSILQEIAFALHGAAS